MRIVLDTNVVVAAGFDDTSASAAIVEAIRRGRIDLVWDDATRAETRSVLKSIPPLSWDAFRDLYGAGGAFDGATEPERFGAVPDPDDRAFAALADAAGAVLISNDDDLLGVRERLGVTVMTPEEFARKHVPRAQRP
ncbi:MAG: PIN domain-containing protein [Myxococcota bacterium]|nr:PIN domain-containing protein [Myxococcota bacterium]